MPKCFTIQLLVDTNANNDVRKLNLDNNKNNKTQKL